MTKHGEKLVGVDEEQLRVQLRTERNPKAIKRLVVMLGYKSGLSPAKIQHKYGWHEQIVYDWLDIVAERGGVALGDLPRGRESFSSHRRPVGSTDGDAASVAVGSGSRRTSLETATRP